MGRRGAGRVGRRGAGRVGRRGAGRGAGRGGGYFPLFSWLKRLPPRPHVSRRALSAAEACKYLQLSISTLLESLVLLSGSHGKCMALVDSFPADAFLALRPHAMSTFVDRLCYALRDALRDALRGVVDGMRVDDEAPAPPRPAVPPSKSSPDLDAVTYSLLRAARFLQRVARLDDCEDLLRIVSAVRVTEWVHDVAVPDRGTTVMDLKEACDLACMRVPPALVAWNLEVAGRLDAEMYQHVVCRHIDHMTPPDFVLLWHVANTLGGEAHSMLARLVWSTQHAGVFVGRAAAETAAPLGFFFRTAGMFPPLEASGASVSMYTCAVESVAPDDAPYDASDGPTFTTRACVDVKLPSLEATSPLRMGLAPLKHDVVFMSMADDVLSMHWYYGCDPGLTVSRICEAGASHMYVLCVPHTYANLESTGAKGSTPRP